MTDIAYASLAEAELIKRVNDEYGHIHHHDKMDYSHAIVIGEALNELKRRKIVSHGEWQGYLKSKCPKISTETANRYMRIAKPDNQAKIRLAVEDKSVVATDLTIAWAEQFLAKPKQPRQQTELPTKSQTAAGGVMPTGDDKPKSDFVPELMNLASDELFPKLRDTWNMDELQKLHSLLGQHLSKVVKQAA